MRKGKVKEGKVEESNQSKGAVGVNKHSQVISQELRVHLVYNHFSFELIIFD